MQLVNMDSLSSSLAASDDADTLYYSEPSSGSGQFFFNSMKQGKQVFAYDMSSGKTTEKNLPL